MTALSPQSNAIKAAGSSLSNAPVALITGASSGIGRELARLFAKDGYALVLVARNQPNLEQLAGELRSTHSVHVTIIVQDLADPDAASRIASELERQSLAVNVLVNNAGTQVYGEFIETSLEQQMEVIHVNIAAFVQLTRLLLPGMVRRGSGRILNVGSTGSFAPGPLNAVYCAAKAFVLSFSQALGAELAGTGVTVTALCPGATATAFVARHGMQDVRYFRRSMSPIRVAEIGYKALHRGCPVVVAGFLNWLTVLTFQLSAPFLPLTPPSMLMRIGKVFMGRSGVST